MTVPVVRVYAVCHNEALLLPYFLRHYEAVAERIFVFDGASTDRSPEILRKHPKVVLEDGNGEFATQRDGRYHELVLMRIRNHAYKRSRGQAEWVIVADIDEIVYHPDLPGRLSALRAEGVTLIKTAGYEMVSVLPPSGQGQIYSEIRAGFRNQRYSKTAIFNPDIDIKYRIGCHGCDPAGTVVQGADPGIKLLHYRFLGPAYFLEKYGKRQERIHAESRAEGWGGHLGVPGAKGEESFIRHSKEQLRKLFWSTLSEQEIIEVVS